MTALSGATHVDDHTDEPTPFFEGETQNQETPFDESPEETPVDESPPTEAAPTEDPPPVAPPPPPPPPEPVFLPDTVIVSGPAGTINEASASFTYEGALVRAARASKSATSIAGYECSLDTSAFVSCDASGIAYPGLSEGSHFFAVRAVDDLGTVDATPASREFVVALPEEVDEPVMGPPPVPEAPDVPDEVLGDELRNDRREPEVSAPPAPAARARSGEVLPATGARILVFVALGMFLVALGWTALGGHQLRSKDKS